MITFYVIGAGFSGAVLARELAESLDCKVIVFDRRDHVAGNCHTIRDAATGVMVHTHGPHIFNTNSQPVWDYVNRFGTFRPFVNRVKASTSRGIFSLPINLHTINQFFGTRFSPIEAETFLRSKARVFAEPPSNFEDYALSVLGEELYETFVYGYTKKQWGVDPRELPASIIKRLPMRFDYNDNYYETFYQGIPENGYTVIIERILVHPRIVVKLGTEFDRGMLAECDHLFYTGPIDAYFGGSEGTLGYRTVYWERLESESAILGTAVMNFPELADPHTRIAEHNYFSHWEKRSRRIAFREFSKETEADDLPYYPKRLSTDLQKAARYEALARQEQKTSFAGRLATYRYLNMDQVIGEALAMTKKFCVWWNDRSVPPPPSILFPAGRENTIENTNTSRV